MLANAFVHNANVMAKEQTGLTSGDDLMTLVKELRNKSSFGVVP